MSIAAALAAKHDEIIELMIRTTMMPAGSSEADTRQFVVGYVSILTGAAHGDFGPRDEYLNSVIPAIRDGGMPLRIVMEGMVRVATAAAALLGPEHAQWLSDFQGDYTVKILDIWEKA